MKCDLNEPSQREALSLDTQVVEHPFNVLHFTFHSWHWSGRAQWCAKAMPLNRHRFVDFGDTNISFIWKKKSLIQASTHPHLYLHTILIYTNILVLLHAHTCPHTHTQIMTTQQKSVSPTLWCHSSVDFPLPGFNAHFSTIMLCLSDHIFNRTFI